MLIKCPGCGQQAKIPDSKEGAKVRCSECERIYLARAIGQASSRKSQGSLLPIGIGAGAVALALILFAISQGGSKAPPPEPPPEVPVVVETNHDLAGWDSVLVKYVRGLHDSAFARNEAELQTELALDRVWARMESSGDDVADPAAYTLLEASAQLQFVAQVLSDLTVEDPINLVGQWKPFDGQVLEEGDTEAHVRLTLQPRDTSDGSTRHIDWRLTKTRFGWKAWSWERWISPEELQNDLRKKSASRAKKTLSDGSIVFEAEVEKVDWMPETSLEERQHIDGLIDKLLNLDARPGEWIQAQDELKIIGKPAIPGLLNRFADLDAAGWEVEERGMQGQRLHITLMEMTDYVTTFNPHEALGGTDERRESGVKQWFFWYNRHFKKFGGPAEKTDLLEEEWEPKTDAEKREYERMKRKIEEEERDGGR